MHCKELEVKTYKFTVVAACDIIPERCKRFEETYGGRSYESVRDQINDPEV
jgi:predicted dehydrogenase